MARGEGCRVSNAIWHGHVAAAGDSRAPQVYGSLRFDCADENEAGKQSLVYTRGLSGLSTLLRVKEPANWDAVEKAFDFPNAIWLGHVAAAGDSRAP